MKYCVRWLLVFGVLANLMVPTATALPIPVKVGEYNFEPFVDGNLGITPAFLTVLNGYQSEYEFEFVRMPARRRFGLLKGGHVDAVFFEMPKWGWTEQGIEIETTRPVLHGKELYVARRDNLKGQQVFTLNPTRKVALVESFHYAFADFNSDQNHINSLVKAQFLRKQSDILKSVQRGFTDVGLMSNIFLNWETKRNPKLRDIFIVGPEIDHEYKLPMIVRKNGPIAANALSEILDRMYADGTLTAFFGGFGLADLVIYDQTPEPATPENPAVGD